MITIFVIILSIALAGFYSGSETGVYCLSRLKLRIGKDKGKINYILLNNLMADQHGLVFTTLSGNSFLHYLATSLVTGIFINRYSNHHTAELYATIILTPCLFVFSEVLPKNIFYQRADKIMPWCSWLLWLSHKFFTVIGIVPTLKYLTRSATKIIGAVEPGENLLSTAQKHHIIELVRETREEGVLSHLQTEIIEQAMNISNVKVGSAMMPIESVKMANVKSNRNDLVEQLRQCRYTNWLVYKGPNRKIVGYVNIYNVLGSWQDFGDLSEFVKPLHQAAADMPIMTALKIMAETGQYILLVKTTSKAEQGKPLGIVTVRNIVDNLIGEMKD